MIMIMMMSQRLLVKVVIAIVLIPLILRGAKYIYQNTDWFDDDWFDDDWFDDSWDDQSPKEPLPPTRTVPPSVTLIQWLRKSSLSHVIPPSLPNLILNNDDDDQNQ